MNEEILYGIALSLLKGIGDVNAKTLISHAGSASALFKMSSTKLQKINGIGPKTAELFKDTLSALQRAETELKFIEKNKIDVLFYYDKRYPKRLLNCTDSPLFIFSKGTVDYNRERFVNIIGTRNSTDYGNEITEKLVAHLSNYNVHLVSGLAYGIDICAHKAALKYDMQNIAVLAHGLDKIYPFQHRQIAERLQQNGAIVSDFLSNTKPDKQNFPCRNRIVAGMSDATIVVESAITGGALITAEIANSYNSDVFAFPGRTTDNFSQGCLQLIKNNKANLVSSPEDIIQFMNWDLDHVGPPINMIQAQLFLELNEHEQLIYDCIKQCEKISIDDIYLKTNIPQSAVSAHLLQLELKGIIGALPGKFFKAI